MRTVDVTAGTLTAPPRPMRWASYVALAMLALLPARMDPPMSWIAGVIQAHAPAGAAAPTSAPADVGPTQPIAGWIVDGAGLPIAGVRVSLRGANATATSEADGAFRIAAPTGKRTLLLDAPHVFPAELAWREGEAPRIMLARRARLEARVVIDGKPIAGAEVQITDGSRPTLATATSDRDGVVRFADLIPGPYELWARRGTTVSPLVRIADVDTKPVELALVPAGTLRGKVVVSDGLPRGVTITIEPLDLDHAVRTATLDEQGRFALEGIPRGRWRVEAAAPGFIPNAEVIETRGVRDEVAVQLLRAGIVTGTVVDHTNTPVANATIVLRPNGATAQPVEERRRVVASARLRWVHPLAGQRVLPAFESSKFGASRAGARPAECGGGHCGLDLGSKTGTVIHAAADGEVALAFTEIRGEAGRYVAIDHGDGVRTFYMHMNELRSGLEIGQRIRAGDPIGAVGSTGASSAPHLHFAITQEQAGRTWYIDPESVIRHSVVLPAARSLDRSEASDTVIASLRWSEVGRALTAPAPQPLVTDAKGRFRVEGVAPGSYVAVAFAPKLAPGTSEAFGVRTAAETGDVLITLSPGTLVHGRVLGRDGAIAGATIVAGAGSGESVHKVASAYTSAAGEFTLHSLTGQVTLSVSAPGYGTIERAITLADRAGQHHEEFTLVIENAQLRGQVLAPDGGSAGPVAIRIIEGPTRRRATTDPSGRFTFGRVATGTYTIELSAADFPAKRVTLESDQFREIRLEAGGGARIALRDTHSSAALANLRIEATGPDKQVIKRTTDAQGVAELRGLAAGEWTIVVRATGYSTLTHTISIKAERVPQDLRLDLARGATIGGVVRDRYGRRVAGAKVSIGTLSTQTDAEGNFRFEDAPIGAQQVEAERADTRAAIAVQLTAGETRLSLSIELPE